MKPGVCAALLLLLSACTGAPRPGPVTAPARAAGGPSLVVVLVVDQMRTDYLERGMPHFTAGLKRLTTEGVWFKNAAYPYLNTITCAGHATIGTGALPYRHGMVLNAWWDRATARSRGCTFDDTVRNIGYTGTPSGGESAAMLLVPTLADQIRQRAAGRTVAMSLKSRSAITLAGSHPTSVVWFDDRAGWTTSTAFTNTRDEWLVGFLAAHPASADLGKVWDRTRAPAAYAGEDAGAGERAPHGWTTSFPHALGANADAAFTTQWQRSPFADEYLGRMAAASVDALKLGHGPGTDFLAVSFSSLDLVGHQFGPASHEVQDMVLRLDRTIGTLLEHLDRAVGRGRYVVALGSDHGVGPLPEQSGAGRQTGADALAAIDRALVPFFGPGKYAVHSAYTDIYLAPGILEKLKGHDTATAAVLGALRSMPGVAHAFRADQISAPEMRSSTDPVKRAAALSHYPARSGDLIIVPKENWLLSTSAATTHGTLYPYDQRVPVVFFGPGVPAGIRDDAATPA
ncbi:MAG TPA: alkaline phosphatase family protein, partial [Vicinamibacterales bacterium]|nr:alkaline phosphatase family protein [Vicinamibacterales bacterium]